MAPDPAGTALDPAVLAQLVALDDGKLDLVREMADLFREDIQGRLGVLDEAFAAQDTTKLSETAHAMKGAAGTVGARQLRDLAAEVEAAGRQGELEAIGRILPQFRPAYEIAMAALEAFAKEGKF